MNKTRWVIGTVLLLALLIGITIRPFPFLFYQDLPYVSFLGRAMFILLLASGMCVFRISRGPTAADRIVAVDLDWTILVYRYWDGLGFTKLHRFSGAGKISRGEGIGRINVCHFGTWERNT
jgi:hypothetical protein